MIGKRNAAGGVLVLLARLLGLPAVPPCRASSLDQAPPNSSSKSACQPRTDASPEAPRPYLRQLLGNPAWLDLTAEYRLRYETEDARYRPGELGSDQQLAHRTRLRMEVCAAPSPFRFVVEFEDARAQLTDSGSTVNQNHVRELGILQLHVKLVTQSLFGRKLASELQFGRLNMDLGKRRLVARNLYRNTTNRFDGLHWRVDAPKKWDFQAFLVQPVVYSLPDLNRGRRQGYFWGAYFQDRRHSWMNRDFYYLHLYEDLKTVPVNPRNLRTFGTRLYANPPAHGWVWDFEAIWQSGRTGKLDHFAHLENVEAGYEWSSPWQPLLQFQYTYASGDRDPSDNRLERFDGLFGARRFELAPTGILGLFSRSNLNAPGWRLLLKPAPRLQLTFVHRGWWLAQSRDEWRGMGRRDPTGASGTRIGQHWEAVARLRATRNLEFEAGYVRFLPGGFVQHQFPGRTVPDCNYFYVMKELRL
jgi:hypothetical protein